ncbi:hypothetical protein KC19_1G179500 [Ceratodon purpureus]|uniref:Uncharacterized protein n=1 Tax=Ceratodon purpureus TaxID=3225 RepID=A0A8T0J774_CERPU|nr:hypothetical protein KC19_1G179500 [Ceratodon purpureus]
MLHLLLPNSDPWWGKNRLILASCSVRSLLLLMSLHMARSHQLALLRVRRADGSPMRTLYTV